MNIDALKPLMDSGVINEATKDAIQEAWNSKLKELQTSIRTEIREEFADRYEHDKDVMVKTLDKMVAETLTKEVEQIKSERNDIAKLKLNTVKEMREAAEKFNKFATRALAEELAEFSTERKKNNEHQDKLERFVMSSLAEEINEFSEDKQALRETRTKLVAEAKNELNKLKSKFVQRSGNAVSKIVSETLNHEITQLYSDIKIARENNFGRKIYEAFASEFENTYLNENEEVNKIKNELAESKKLIKEKTQLLEGNQNDLRRLRNEVERKKVISELLDPLVKEKKEVMSQLLEGVQTNRLKVVFDKYLPSVLNESGSKTKKLDTLTESTGNRNTKVVPIDDTDLSEIKRLAGLQ